MADRAIPAGRRAGLAETAFLASHLELDGSTQSVMAAEFSSPLPPRLIIDGLRALSRRQPMLRARLCGAAPHWGFEFDVTVGDVAIRTRPQSHDPLDAIFAADCDNLLDLRQGPLWRVMLVTRDGEATAVVVTFAHAIVDGVSATAFLRQLLDPASATDPYPVMPSLEELLPVPSAAAGASADGTPAGGPTGEWPFDDASRPSQRRTNVVLGRVGPEYLDGLLRRCRAERVSVDSFLVSSIQAALARHIPAALSVPVICAFDARPALRPPVPAGEIGMYMKDLRLSGPGPAALRDLWDRAREITQQVRACKKKALDQPETLTAAEIHAQIRLAAEYPLRSFPFGFSVSNLGRQPVISGLRSLFLSSTDRIGIMGFQVVAAELHGELFLTFVHADPLVAPTAIAALRDEVIAMVCSATSAGKR